MKNMKAMLAIVLALSLGGGAAFASVGLKENGINKGPTEEVNFVDGPSITGTGEKSVDFSPMTYEGTTADAYETSLDVTDPTADRSITLPNASGMVPVYQASFSASKMWMAFDAVASGQTSKAVTVTGVSTSSRCVSSIAEVATNSVYVRAVVPTANTVTVTLSGDPGASNADIAVFCGE